MATVAELKAFLKDTLEKKRSITAFKSKDSHTDLLENGLEDMGRGWGEM